MKVNPLDIVFIVIIAAGAIRVAIRGFIAEIMSVAALILGVAAAVFFSKAGALLIDTYIGFSRWNQIVAFLVIFLAVYLIIKLIENVLHKVLEKIQLDRLDRALGLFLGLIEGGLAVIFLVYLLTVQPLFELGTFLEKSSIARFIIEFLPVAVPALQEAVQSAHV